METDEWFIGADELQGPFPPTKAFNETQVNSGIPGAAESIYHGQEQVKQGIKYERTTYCSF